MYGKGAPVSVGNCSAGNSMAIGSSFPCFQTIVGALMSSIFAGPNAAPSCPSTAYICNCFAVRGPHCAQYTCPG